MSELRPRGAESPPSGLAGRVESAEGAVRALEERLGGILRRIDDSEEQRRRAMDRLAESERQVQLERSARERAERMLVSMRSAQRRMALVLADLRELTSRLRAIAERDERPADSAVPAAAPEPGAEAAEEEARRREMADALAAAITRLRARVAAVGESHAQRLAEEEQGRAGERAAPPADETGVPDHPLAQEPEREAPQPERVPEPEQPVSAAASELAPSAREPEPVASERSPQRERAGRPVEVLPRVIGAGEGRGWLAPAIRSVAARRDPKMAGELIAELLPARRPDGELPMRYGVKIEQLGAFNVRVEEQGVSVRRERSPEGLYIAEPEFVLEGPVEAFARLVAGGRGRALRGLRVHGSRRRARRLAAATGKPLALADLAALGLEVWPGLLLLALAEAIDPAWTAGQSFVVAFAIEGPSSATVRVSVRDGEPVLITRGHDGEAPAALTARLSERAFICLFAGVSLPGGERISVDGDLAALQQLLELTDRAQGLRSPR